MRKTNTNFADIVSRTLEQIGFVGECVGDQKSGLESYPGEIGASKSGTFEEER